MHKVFAIEVLLCIGLLITACSPASPPQLTIPTIEPQVVATSWMAELVGELIVTEQCIRVNDRDSSTSYLLVWPSSMVATIENDTVRVITDVTVENLKEIVLPVGKNVRLGGGETDSLDETTKQTVPENCAGPYWVVGTEIVALDEQ